MDKDLIEQILKDYSKVVQTETTEARLDRIEQKIDKLADAMISLARAEEKIIALQDDHTNHTERLNRLSVKLDEIQKVVDDNSRTVGLINRIGMAILVAAIGAYVAHVWM